MDNRPIGMFDSGIGGLTVLKEVKRILPNEEIIFRRYKKISLWFKI